MSKLDESNRDSIIKRSHIVIVIYYYYYYYYKEIILYMLEWISMS
jgi:hypothetical protein